MYKIISNRAITYSCTCPQCDSDFLFTQSELHYDDAFSDDTCFDCPCCGTVLTKNKAVKMLYAHDSFNETTI